MDSLKIQDAFEPYYAGRGRFASDRKLSGANGINNLKQLWAAYKQRLEAKCAGKTGNAMEH